LEDCARALDQDQIDKVQDMISELTEYISKRPRERRKADEW